MKKIVLIVVAIVSLFASVDWRTNFDKAYQESKSSGKPLFVFIERRNPPCHWCEKMKHTTLADSNISRYINKTFIPVKIDRDASDYPQELFPRYVPTIYIIDKNKILKKIIGYWPKSDFWSDLEDVRRVLQKGNGK